MEKNEEQFIGSESETIETVKHAKLIEVTLKVGALLTEQEWRGIMNIYDEAITRVLKENNMEV